MFDRLEPMASPTSRFEDLPQVALVETDCYCQGCGYNLRTQAVRRDPRTQLLIARCPECQRYHPAAQATTVGRLWLQRLATLLLFVWIALVGSGIVGILFGQGGLSYGTLDELTTSRFVSATTPMPPTPPAPSTQPAVGGLTGQVGPFQTISSTTFRTTWRRFRTEVREDYKHYNAFLALTGTGSLAVGFIAGMLAVVVFHHWPRWAYWPAVLSAPVLVAMIVWFVWRAEAPHLLAWGTPYVCGHALVQMLGGAAGIVAGRPLARLIVRIFLPPRARPVLAFLWLADNQPLPQTTGDRATEPA